MRLGTGPCVEAGEMSGPFFAEYLKGLTRKTSVTSVTGDAAVDVLGIVSLCVYLGTWVLGWLTTGCADCWTILIAPTLSFGY